MYVFWSSTFMVHRSSHLKHENTFSSRHMICRISYAYVLKNQSSIWSGSNCFKSRHDTAAGVRVEIWAGVRVQGWINFFVLKWIRIWPPNVFNMTHKLWVTWSCIEFLPPEVDIWTIRVSTHPYKLNTSTVHSMVTRIHKWHEPIIS